MGLQLPDLLHAVVGCSVDLNHIKAFTCRDGKTVTAKSAGFASVFQGCAVKGFCQQPCQGRFAAPPGAGMQ